MIMKGSFYQSSLCTQREFSSLCYRLRASFRMDALPVHRLTRSFFDTFDWRLFRNGWVLEFDDCLPPVARLRGAGAAAKYEEQALERIPRFACELPIGPIRKQLQATTGDRALMNLGNVNLRVTPYRASDDQQKLVFFLDKEQLLQPGDGRRGRTLLVSVRIRTLRGYEKAGRHALSFVEQRAARPSLPPDAFDRCMPLLGRTPGDYSTRLRVHFAPGMGARTAVAQILLFLLDIMERNLPGIETDLDTEFLHDFRIAARRSRSIINKTLGVFAAPELARFKREFSWLSKITCGQRDLDVFLHDLSGYQADQDADLSGQLAPLRTMLEEERRAEHARLVATLGSERLQGFLRDWRELMVVTADAAADGAGPPLLGVASRSIARLYRRVLKRAPQAGAGLYSEALHELRKTGKQLRYLLEAFRSLYNEEDIELIIAQLRRLQNVLGDIVDFHVQRTRLLAWRERLGAQPDNPTASIAAIERLAERFDALERQAAERFLGRYARFTAPETRARIDRLFGEAA